MPCRLFSLEMVVFFRKAARSFYHKESRLLLWRDLSSMTSSSIFPYPRDGKKVMHVALLLCFSGLLVMARATGLSTEKDEKSASKSKKAKLTSKPESKQKNKMKQNENQTETPCATVFFLM